MRAREFMTSPVVTVAPDAAVKDVARLLLRHAISAVPVVDADGHLVGIVSELDLLLGDVPADPTAHVMPPEPEAGAPPHVVADVMTRGVVAVSEETDAADVARVMREASLKSIPVVRGEDVVGIVSRRDLLRSIARDDDVIRDDVLRRLREYADGRESWDVTVDAGVVSIYVPEEDPVVREAAVLLTRTVPGALRVHLVDRTRPAGPETAEATA
jgi:CBS-domain-containing membrane protein